MERRKILRQYFLSLTFILCLFAFLTGVVTVREKTRYNMDMTPYNQVAFEKKADGIEVEFSGRSYFVSFGYIEKTGKEAFYALMGDFFTKTGDILEKMPDKR